MISCHYNGLDAPVQRVLSQVEVIFFVPATACVRMRHAEGFRFGIAAAAVGGMLLLAMLLWRRSGSHVASAPAPAPARSYAARRPPGPR
jgi:hypothetical protein